MSSFALAFGNIFPRSRARLSYLQDLVFPDGLIVMIWERHSQVEGYSEKTDV